MQPEPRQTLLRKRAPARAGRTEPVWHGLASAPSETCRLNSTDAFGVVTYAYSCWLLPASPASTEGRLVQQTELAENPVPAEAVFVFGSIAMKRGGVTRAILDRVRMFAAAGVTVKLLLTEYGSHEDDEETAIRAAWSLPDSVEVRYFWREAAPGGGGASPDSLAVRADEPDTTSLTEATAKGTRTRFFVNGVPTKTKHFRADGSLVRIDAHNRAGHVGSREYFDPQGRLVCNVECHPADGRRALRRWFARSGVCWLTNWFDQTGQPQQTVSHVPEVVAFDHWGQCVARWVDAVLAGCQAPPVVFSDSRRQDHSLLAVTHPRAVKVAVLHNPHTRKPYGASDEVKSTWRPLLDNLDQLAGVVTLTDRQRRDIADRYQASNVTAINHPARVPSGPVVERRPGLLVAVARLEPQKRLDDAIRAFAFVAEQLPEARFDIYGTGAETNNLKSLVHELGLGDRIRFRGFTTRSQEVFATASATVLSSNHEGFPLVLGEAMSMGTPFAAYDINYGPAEIIRHGIDGLLVPPGDVDALAAALVRLLSDPEYAAQLGERAREITDRFATQRWRREWLHLLDTLSEQAGERAGLVAETTSRG